MPFQNFFGLETLTTRIAIQELRLCNLKDGRAVRQPPPLFKQSREPTRKPN